MVKTIPYMYTIDSYRRFYHKLYLNRTYYTYYIGSRISNWDIIYECDGKLSKEFCQVFRQNGYGINYLDALWVSYAAIYYYITEHDIEKIDYRNEHFH